MRMKKRDCIIIVSGIIRQRKDVIRSRIRLDWQVVIQLCMDMFMIHCVSLIHLVWQFCLKLVLRSVYKELHADHETGAADNK